MILKIILAIIWIRNSDFRPAYFTVSVCCSQSISLKIVLFGRLLNWQIVGHYLLLMQVTVGWRWQPNALVP